MCLKLFEFVAGLHAERLREAGYALSEDPAQAVLDYHNVRLRSIPVKPRKVRRCNGYSVPDHLSGGEREFVGDVVAGNPLRPYQSRRLDRAAAFDGMLFDYGIHHFHPSATPHAKDPRYRQRTEPLLFAMVTDTDLYCLGFFGHGDWSRGCLMDIAHENWPELLERVAVPETKRLRQDYDDRELARLRSARINTATRRPDGTVHFGAGGGITTNGGSILASFRLVQLENVCADLDRQVCSTARGMVLAGELASLDALSLRIMGDRIHVVGPDLDFTLEAEIVPRPL